MPRGDHLQLRLGCNTNCPSSDPALPGHVGRWLCHVSPPCLTLLPCGSSLQLSVWTPYHGPHYSGTPVKYMEHTRLVSTCYDSLHLQQSVFLPRPAYPERQTAVPGCDAKEQGEREEGRMTVVQATVLERDTAPPQTDGQALHSGYCTFRVLCSTGQLTNGSLRQYEVGWSDVSRASRGAIFCCLQLCQIPHGL